MSTEDELRAQRRRLKEIEAQLKRERENAPLPEFHDIPKRIVDELESRPLLTPFAITYKRSYKFINYAFVCGGIGTLVNYIVYHTMTLMIWEPIAFYFGVGVAAISNYLFTVGPLGYMFMLSDKE